MRLQFFRRWVQIANCLVFLFFALLHLFPQSYIVSNISAFLITVGDGDERDSGGANFGQSWICVSSAFHIFCKLRKSDLLPVCFFC